ncbi:MAG: prepilin-type N-terminal cleavage/methylation domain-containing protein [Actinomycetota bacterium]|nr:prepilin-type N-terminal cleavage/methylation domain-containing protein [Actinomycetota bacterium]
MKRFIHREEGFTLVELMIVILILAILVAIAVPVYLKAQDNAKKNTCKSNLRTIDGSIQTYQANTESDFLPGTAVSQLVTWKYLKSEPKCPQGPTTYITTGATPQVEAKCVSGAAGHSY